MFIHILQVKKKIVKGCEGTKMHLWYVVAQGCTFADMLLAKIKSSQRFFAKL